MAVKKVNDQKGYYVGFNPAYFDEFGNQDGYSIYTNLEKLKKDVSTEWIYGYDPEEKIVIYKLVPIAECYYPEVKAIIKDLK